MKKNNHAISIYDAVVFPEEGEPSKKENGIDKISYLYKTRQISTDEK